MICYLSFKFVSVLCSLIFCLHRIFDYFEYMLISYFLVFCEGCFKTYAWNYIRVQFHFFVQVESSDLEIGFLRIEFCSSMLYILNRFANFLHLYIHWFLWSSVQGFDFQCTSKSARLVLCLLIAILFSEEKVKFVDRIRESFIHLNCLFYDA